MDVGRDTQQPMHWRDENMRAYTSVNMNNVSLVPNNDANSEQQIVYLNHPMNYQPISNAQPFMYQQQMSNGQLINQYSTANPMMHQQYRNVLSVANIPPTSIERTIMHANMNQQECIPSYHPVMNVAAPALTSVTNPPVASTPISATTKRGRNDTSGVSDSNVQLRPQQQQSTRTTNELSSTLNKRRRGGYVQQNNRVDPQGPPQQTPEQLAQNVHSRGGGMVNDENSLQPSVAACRFAATRYPFSPFTVIFQQETREKIILDDLIKYARDNKNFELKIAAYRRGRAENNECRVLIFVGNSDSFAFLYDRTNWPTTLAASQYSTKSPSIPPQLSLVLPYVSLQTVWEDFVQELKERYPGVANIIRLRNQAQEPVRAVKLEFLSSKLRNEMLENGEISVLYMKYKVVEYYAQAKVLFCSNCYRIGHFKKNCPQTNEVTCRICGEKCPNLKDHHCSGIVKCVHCGEAHNSTDVRCKVVKDYRTALTRNLMSNIVAANADTGRSHPRQANAPAAITTVDSRLYSTVAQLLPTNLNDVLEKKLDGFLAKVEEEFKATRSALESLKVEMQNQYKVAQQQVDLVENKVITLEKKLETFSTQISVIVENLCTSMVDPQGAQGTKWKAYWQEQSKALADGRASIRKTVQ